MSQQLNLPPVSGPGTSEVLTVRRFYQSYDQRERLGRILPYHPQKTADISGLFGYATQFVHQWQEHLAEGRTVQLVSCGGNTEDIRLWRRDVGRRHSKTVPLPAAISMPEGMWRKVADIGHELGYFREQGVPPRFISDETMGNIMASIWEMYLVVCYRVLRERNRVKIPSYKATPEIRDANGNVIIPAKRGDCARTIRLV